MKTHVFKSLVMTVALAAGLNTVAQANITVIEQVTLNAWNTLKNDVYDPMSAAAIILWVSSSTSNVEQSILYSLKQQIEMELKRPASDKKTFSINDPIIKKLLDELMPLLTDTVSCVLGLNADQKAAFVNKHGAAIRTKIGTELFAKTPFSPGFITTMTQFASSPYFKNSINNLLKTLPKQIPAAVQNKLLAEQKRIAPYLK